MLFEPYVRFHILVFQVTEWPPIGEKLLTRLTICFLGISVILVFSVFYAATKEILWILLTLTIKLMLSRV